MVYRKKLGDIRRVFARQSGKPVGLFSNNGAGACPTCKGRGVVRTDLAFLDTVESVCEICDGSGYSAETTEDTAKLGNPEFIEQIDFRDPKEEAKNLIADKIYFIHVYKLI